MPSVRNFITILIVFLFVSGIPFNASHATQRDKAEPSAAFVKLLQCRGETDEKSRLACFDREVEAIEAARIRQDIVIVDKTEVSKARKSLFGLNLPDLGLFGGGQSDESDKEEGVGFIDTTIASARQSTDGKWIIVLPDGARWMQTEYQMVRTPKPGDTVRIKRGALGSFMANINGRPAIRVKRLN